jgi:hypothetical protein
LKDGKRHNYSLRRYYLDEDIPSPAGLPKEGS